MGGSLAAADFIHESSGSSGQPTLWPRTCFDELAVCDRFEQLLWDNWQAHKHSTLAVVCLPMGCWVGGLFTSLCLRFLTLKGYKLTLVTPGNKLPDILQLVPALAPHYEQTVLFGYPPFLKGVVDAGIAAGLPWADWNVKMVLAGEVFSEEWRSLMAQRLGVRDILRDIVSLYGTADAGVIGNETPLSVAIRRWLAAHPEAAAELFGAQRLPTLVQYDPFSRLLETHPEDGTLVVSSVATPHTAAPLLRYCIGDAGGTVSYSDMLEFLKQRGFKLPAGLQHRPLPFAFVFGRSFWTVSVFGCNVYVENIMSGLEQPELAGSTTGKFVLYVEESADLDSQLALRVELAPGVQPSTQLEQQVAAVVLRELRRLNSEYRSYVPEDKQMPIVRLHPYGDPGWFPVGLKHKWTA
ncbi:phenylacetate-- ligase [Chlorella sorokiniana]|uniref:Phenylacetate--ligase n=1 Tax=Chlorella sorokiniana TaxID=3076 RepID=A0A2P6U3W0_CHLSO|nr:phenylacetate-- ligase [Chlorella sorokiniana]|eukprot:PRW60995.1 phenylacetate-- ligase [Chlorella sorokiniana]